MISEKSHRPDRDIVTDREEKPKLGVEQSSKEDENTERRLKESHISYLQRAGEQVTKKLKERFGTIFDPNRLQENDLPQDVLNIIESITIEALESQKSSANSIKDEEVINDIEGNIGYHNRGELADSDLFDKTQRSRKFFEIQPGKGASKRETYWNTLFFPYNTQATRAFAKKTLDDKTIVLLGGGRSQLKRELAENNIVPRKIVNVDPFVENVGEGADTVIPVSASDDSFMDKMSEEGVVKADEIWAEYSVPAYLEDPKEIQLLIQNIDALLVEGGSARIWPLEVGGRGEDEDRTARKDALTQSIKNIYATNKYEIIPYKAAGRPGIILHKLAPSKEELQKKDDQEKIKKIREKLGINS
ncbi:MAG: hypothetical protein PF549_02610 [Patescibacteria group bacterium]|jgi:hypothetical protein|nr:hypothetical protein [Patescibacteria group bacterium]